MLTIIIYTIAFIVLVYAAISDIKTREVPDWLSYTTITTGFTLNLIFSVYFLNYTYILDSLLGFGVAFSIACLMFYSGQWGGGDSKLLMGLGALIGLPIAFEFTTLPILIINIFIVGSFYGLVWSVVIGLANLKKIIPFMKKHLAAKKAQSARNMLFVFVIVSFLIFAVLNSQLSLFVLLLSVISYSIFYIWLFVLGIEKCVMQVYISPKKLTEGDWIAEDVMVKGQYICGPKDLGIEQDQINLLIQNGVKKVLVKNGIPFIPGFLLAFIVTLAAGAWWQLLVF